MNTVKNGSTYFFSDAKVFGDNSSNTQGMNIPDAFGRGWRSFGTVVSVESWSRVGVAVERP